MCCGKVSAESSWEMNYLDFQKALDKFAVIKGTGKAGAVGGKAKFCSMFSDLLGGKSEQRGVCCSYGLAEGCSSPAGALSLKYSVKFA